MACKRGGAFGTATRTLVSRSRLGSATKAATLLTSDHPALLSLKDIPGPRPSLPFIGTAWQYFPVVGRYSLSNIYESCIDKHGRYGPAVREEFQWRRPVVHLSNPEDYERVSMCQGRQPIRPIAEFVKHYRENNPDRYNSVGLANSLGDEWERLRKVLGPALLRMNALEYIVRDMNHIFDDFVALLRQGRDPETQRIGNLQDYIYRMSLEAIYMLSLDTRLGCLEESLEGESPAGSMIQAVKLLFEAFQALFYGLPLWKLFPTPAYKKLATAESILYDTCSQRIQEVIEQLRNQKNPAKLRDSVLQTLINTKGLTDKEIRVTVIDFISGGIFTVTNAFSFLLYHISRNQDVQEKLYKEVREVCPDSVVTSESLDNLKYLRACVKESFRLTPTIPTITRILPEDIVASGYHIPAGTPLFCNFAVSCRQQERFPDPDRFLPERWMRREVRPMTMLPFGFGVRMCVGRRFAETEMFMALAKLIYNFKLESTGQEVKCKQAFIIVPSHPVSITFKDRKSC